MPSCAAAGCSSRSDRGELLKIFPRKDKQRRHIWINRVNRPGWTPTKYSALCWRHFDRDQWEVPREDGKRKLKHTAVPTIFCVGHPTLDDKVFRDHPYCVVGYRQLYFDETEATEQPGEDEEHPIEHIKIEADENENFTSELIEANNDNDTQDEDRESENLGNEIEEEEEEEFEDIQCTPDISVFPEKGEPFPMESVDCEEEAINSFLNEPSADPLAISAADVVQSRSVVPHFKHSKKFVFVTKDTKYVTPRTSMVYGEPRASVEPPALGLLDSQHLLKSAAVTRLPTLTPAPKIRTEKIFAKSDLPKTLPSPPRLQVIPPCITLSPPKLKVISQKINHLESPGTPKPQLMLLNSSKHGTKFVSLARSKQEPVASKGMVLIQKKPFNNSSIIKPKLLGSALTNNSFSDLTNDKRTKVVVNSMDNYVQLENIYAEHEYTNKQMWRPVTMDGLNLNMKQPSSSGKKVNLLKLLGNNDVKMWLNKRKVNSENSSKTTLQFKRPLPKESSSTDTLKIKKLKFIPTIRSSSVVVLNPFQKPQPVDHIYKLPLKNDKTKFYECTVCKFSFLTLAALQVHMSKHIESKPADESENEVEIVFNGSQNMEKKLMGFENRVQLDSKKKMRMDDLEGLNIKSKSKNRGIKNSKRFEDNQIHDLNALKGLCCNKSFKLSSFISDEDTNSEGFLGWDDTLSIESETQQNQKKKSQRQTDEREDNVVGLDPAKGKKKKKYKTSNLKESRYPLRALRKTSKPKQVTSRKNEKGIINDKSVSYKHISEESINNEEIKKPVVLIPKLDSMLFSNRKIKKEKPEAIEHVQKRKKSVTSDPKPEVCSKSNYTCSLCQKNFSKNNEMQRHLRFDHRNEYVRLDKRPLSGPYCKTKVQKHKLVSRKSSAKHSCSFSDTTSVNSESQQHLSDHQCTQSTHTRKRQLDKACTNADDSKGTSGVCGIVNSLDCQFLKKKKGLPNHMLIHKKSRPQKSQPEKACTNTDVCKGASGVCKILNCFVCRLVEKKKRFSNHKLNHTKPVISCSKTMKNKSQSQSTFRAEHNSPRKQTGKSYKPCEGHRKDWLEGNAKCPICKLAVSKNMLKTHMLFHTKLEFSCDLCEKKFQRSFQLRRHVNAEHKVVHAFKCSQRDCGRSFESKRNLEKHSRIHKK